MDMFHLVLRRVARACSVLSTLLMGTAVGVMLLDVVDCTHRHARDTMRDTMILSLFTRTTQFSNELCVGQALEVTRFTVKLLDIRS